MNRIRTAAVIGGTSGLGRSVAEALADAGVQVTAYGRSLPETACANIEFQPLNLLCGDLSPLEAKLDVDALIYAAGIGRIAPFDQLTDGELTALFKAYISGR